MFPPEWVAMLEGDLRQKAENFGTSAQPNVSRGWIFGNFGNKDTGDISINWWPEAESNRQHGDFHASAHLMFFNDLEAAFFGKRHFRRRSINKLGVYFREK